MSRLVGPLDTTKNAEMAVENNTWWFNWTNDPCRWTQADNPPAPHNAVAVAGSHNNNGKGKITSDVLGLEQV